MTPCSSLLWFISPVVFTGAHAGIKQKKQCQILNHLRDRGETCNYSSTDIALCWVLTVRTRAVDIFMSCREPDQLQALWEVDRKYRPTSNKIHRQTDTDTCLFVYGIRSVFIENIPTHNLSHLICSRQRKARPLCPWRSAIQTNYYITPDTPALHQTVIFFEVGKYQKRYWYCNVQVPQFSVVVEVSFQCG